MSNEQTNLAGTNPGYLLLFRGGDWDEGLSIEELRDIVARLTAWSERLQRSGKVRGGNVLGKTRKLVSGKNGAIVADGPFAESKEAVGGYLLLQVDTLEEALSIARSCPGLDYGNSVEVRPVLEECPVFARMKQRLKLAVVA